MGQQAGSDTTDPCRRCGTSAATCSCRLLIWRSLCFLPARLAVHLSICRCYNIDVHAQQAAAHVLGNTRGASGNHCVQQVGEKQSCWFVEAAQVGKKSMWANGMHDFYAKAISISA